MPKNPLKSTGTKVRRMRYHPLYSSAEAAEFADVPKATVYRAMRLGQLPTAESVPGHPRISHEALVTWMDERGFPVPQEAIVLPDRLAPARQPMTPIQAARYAKVSRERIISAINGGALKAIGPTLPRQQPRIRQEALDAWVQGGKLMAVARPRLEAHSITNHLPEFVQSHELSPKLIADQGERLRLPRSMTLALLRGNLDHLNMYNLAVLLPVLSGMIGRPVALGEVVTLTPAGAQP